VAPYQWSKTPAINDRDGNTSERITTDTHTKRRRKEIKKKATTTLNFFKPNKNKKVEKKKLKEREKKEKEEKSIFITSSTSPPPPSSLLALDFLSLVSLPLFLSNQKEKKMVSTWITLCSVSLYVSSSFQFFYFFFSVWGFSVD
jgi:hypothetical protein